MKVGICGLGVVGSAIMQSLISHGFTIDTDLFIYDKYKSEYSNNFNVLAKTDILFVALPTPFDQGKNCFDTEPLKETLDKLHKLNYVGIIVLKSTLEPLTTDSLGKDYPLDIVHNPEFLSAKTAFEDFHNQKHIVLGRSTACNNIKYNMLIDFYKKYYPNAEISLCTASESESMKIFANSFYATKIQFFTEMYLLTEKLNIKFTTVKDLMLKNGWINSMHTQVPGSDGKLSFGGMCFPKDTMALLKFMQKNETPNSVLKAVVEERDNMRL